MGVTQYTTPTFTLTFTDEELDLTQARNVYVTFSSAGGNFTKTGDALTVEAKSISVFLSQEETGRLNGIARIQANWVMPNGMRAASNISAVQIDAQLLRRVVE